MQDVRAGVDGVGVGVGAGVGMGSGMCVGVGVGRGRGCVSVVCVCCVRVCMGSGMCVGVGVGRGRGCVSVVCVCCVRVCMRAILQERYVERRELCSTQGCTCDLVWRGQFMFDIAFLQDCTHTHECVHVGMGVLWVCECVRVYVTWEESYVKRDCFCPLHAMHMRMCAGYDVLWVCCGCVK